MAAAAQSYFALWRNMEVGFSGGPGINCLCQGDVNRNRKPNEEEVGSFFLQTSNCPLEPISTELNREQLTEEKCGFQILG